MLYRHATGRRFAAVMSIQKNTAYNLVGALIPAALSLVSIPLYIGLIGDARYGVLAVAWLLLDYFGLFDLGLGRATAQRIASLANAGPEERAASFWTALAFNVGLGVIGGLVIWPAALYFFGHGFSVESALRTELAQAIPWLVLAVPLATISGVLTGALQGRAQFLELNIISVVGSALIQLVPLSVAWLYGPNLAWLLPAVILSRVVTLSALFWRCRVHIFIGQPRIISGTYAKGLLRFGGWVSVTALVSPIMVILDRFVIGAALGAKAVTYYTVPFQLAQRSAIIPGALSSAIFPRLATADATDGRKLTLVAMRSLAVVMTPLMLTGVLLIDPFLGWWISHEFASQASSIGQILLLGFWINAFAVIPYAQLQAAGRPDLVAKCHLAEVIPYLILLLTGLHFFGLQGAATVFGLRACADWILLMFFSRNLREGVKLLYLPLLILLTGITVAVGLSINSTAWWMSSVGLLSLALLWSGKNSPTHLTDIIMQITRACGFKSRAVSSRNDSA